MASWTNSYAVGPLPLAFVLLAATGAAAATPQPTGWAPDAADLARLRQCLALHRATRHTPQPEALASPPLSPAVLCRAELAATAIQQHGPKCVADDERCGPVDTPPPPPEPQNTSPPSEGQDGAKGETPANMPAQDNSYLNQNAPRSPSAYKPKL